MALKLADAFVLFRGDSSQLDKDLAQSEGKTRSWASNLGGTVNKLVAGAMIAGTAAVVAGIGAVGAIAFSTAQDLDTANNKLQSQMGVTEQRANELGAVVKSVFRNNFGESIEDVNQSLITTAQNLTKVREMSDQEIGKATENAIALRDAFELEVNESTDAAATLMKDFGLTSEEAFDFITAGMQRGLNRSGDFLDTITEYSTQFANGGASAAEMFSLLESGLQGGMLGTDRAADAFKEFRVRIQDGSALTADSLEMLGLSADEFAAAMANGDMTAAEAFEHVLRGLAELDDENLRMQAGVGLLGTQFEDLGTDAALALSLAGTSMEDLAGATGSLNAQYNDLPTVIEGFKRRAMLAIAPIGDAILNLANVIMPKVNEAFDRLEPVIAGLATWMQRTIGAIQAGGIEQLFLIFEDGSTRLEDLFEIFGMGEAQARALAYQVIALVEGFSAFFAQVVTFVGTHAEEFKGALMAIGAVLAAAAIYSGIIAIVGAIAALATPIGLIMALVALLGAAWAGNWGDIQGKTQAAVEFIQGAIAAFTGFIQGLWARHGDDLIGTARRTWEFIQGAIRTATAVISSILAAFRAAREGDWRAFGENLRAAWQALWDKQQEILGTAKAWIEGKIRELISSIVAWFRDFDWSQLGKNIISGLGRGIDDGRGDIIAKIRRMAEAAWEAIKGFFGISSDSKLMIKAGQWIVGGLARGLGNLDPVNRAIQDINRAVTGAITANITGGGAFSVGAGSGGGDTLIFNIDARGAAPGTADNIAGAVEAALKRAGRRVDSRVRAR